MLNGGDLLMALKTWWCRKAPASTTIHAYMEVQSLENNQNYEYHLIRYSLKIRMLSNALVTSEKCMHCVEYIISLI